MTSEKRNVLDVDELMRRVRAEVENRRAANGSLSPQEAKPLMTSIQVSSAMPFSAFHVRPSGKVPVASPPALPNEQRYLLNQLLAFHDHEFVRQAYLALLKRLPDASGETHFLGSLRAGELTKIEVLGRLLYSPEGKARKVKVEGLLLPLIVQHAGRWPVAGYLISLGNFLLRLPVVVRNFQRTEAHSFWMQAQLVEATNRHADEIDSVQRRMGETLQSSLQSLAATKSDMADLDALRTQNARLESALVQLREENQRIESTLVATRGELEQSVKETIASVVRRLDSIPADIETANKDSALQVRQIADQIGRMEAGLDAYAPMTAIAELRQGLGEMNAVLDSSRTDLAQKLSSVQESVERLRQEVSGLVQGEWMVELRSNLTTVQEASELRVAGLAERIAGVQAHVDARWESLGAADAERQAQGQSQAQVHSEHIDGVRQSLESLRSTIEPLMANPAEIARIESRLLDYRRTLLDTQRRTGLLLEEARKRLPAPMSETQVERLVEEEDHQLDAFYVSFEDQFRGTREDIKQRAEHYLPLVVQAKVGTADAPVLDLGCGRGEWLELLRDNGLAGRGIDLNRVMIEQCGEFGLRVEQAEAIDYLRGLPANSIGAVTAMHLIEHLPFRVLVTLFDEALRVLRPGGLVMFETPNPENIVVGSCSFYMDPTHRNPLPPLLVQFVAEARGFVGAEIHRLSENRGAIPVLATLDASVPGASQVNTALATLHRLTAAAPDYALIARKA